MAYFNPFSYILYPDFQDPATTLILKNITSRVVRKINPYDDKSVFYKYTATESENIESISNSLYGTQELYWTILIANNLFDRFWDFPLSEKELNNFIADKYGSVEIAQNQFKYYIRPNEELTSFNPTEDTGNFQEVPYGQKIIIGGFSYDSWEDFPQYLNGILMKYSKDLYTIEAELNESKRTFYVVTKDYIGPFVKEFERLIA